MKRLAAGIGIKDFVKGEGAITCSFTLVRNGEEIKGCDVRLMSKGLPVEKLNIPDHKDFCVTKMYQSGEVRKYQDFKKGMERDLIGSFGDSRRLVEKISEYYEETL